jgi:hypothetical protein
MYLGSENHQASALGSMGLGGVMPVSWCIIISYMAYKPILGRVK